MQKQITILAVVLALFASIALVTAQDDIESLDPTGVTITYWHEWDGEQQTGIDAVIDAFEASNEYGITVEQVQLGSSGTISENMSTGIVSGELPNLVGNAFVGNAQSWFLDDVLVTLDAYYDSPTWGFTEEETALFDQSLLDINRPVLAPFNGQLMSWPVGLSSTVLAVNMDMVTGDLGFEGAPATLEDFREVACQANELTTEDGADVQGFPLRLSAFDMYAFIVSQGGFIFDEEANAYNITNESSIATLQFFQDIFNEGCAFIPDTRFPDSGIMALGLAPMAMGSTVGTPFVNGGIADSGSGIENWIQTTVPWTEGNRTLPASLRSVAIIEGTPEENLATWLFIKFWATDQESQIAWTEGAQYQPYNTSTRAALSGDFLGANPQFNSVFEALNDESIQLWSQISHPAQRDVNDVFASMLTNITTGGQDVAEAAAAAEAEMNELFAEDLEILAEMAG